MRLSVVSKKLVGEKLSVPIYTEKGLMFLNRGNNITESLIPRLKKMGINTIYIEDDNDDITLQEVLPTPIKIQCIQSLVDIFNEAKNKNHVDYDKVSQIITNIITNINLSENAALISSVAPNSEASRLATHCVEVTILSIIIGIKKKLNDSKLIHLGLASLLHDIGKLFTDSDEHFKIGSELLKKSTMFTATIYMTIYYLYERMDGLGPFKISGEKLHEFVKIISICNDYVDITTGENEILPHEAIEKLTAIATTKFDNEIFKDFIESIYCYPNGLNVRLNNDLSGLVVMQNKGVTTRPIIQIKKNNSNHFFNLLDKENLTLFIQEVVL